MQKIARILDMTWALVKAHPEAQARYGSNPFKGKEYNLQFKKLLTCKFAELIPRSATVHVMLF